jgi:hypothetical protein
MTPSNGFRAALAAILAALLLAPPVLADTCCANTAVGLEPASAMPGDSVRVVGITCLRADNSPSGTLEPQRFWLWPGTRAAEAFPDTTPGEGLPVDLPAVETWPSLSSFQALASDSAIVTLTVPDLAPGTYQLWWWCDDGSGPGGGIHYSTGPRLSVGVPDTATAPGVVEPIPARNQAWLVAGLVGLAALTFVTVVFRSPRRRSR